MRVEKKRGAYGLALACSVLANLAWAGSTDLAAPELKPVTSTSVQAAIGVDTALASRRLASLTGDPASLVSSIVQQGSGNRVDLAQAGRSNEANVNQQGSSNTVAASQESQFNRLDLEQLGNGNTASFSQAGGARASVIQTGDAHKAEVNQTAHSPAIVIRQTGTGTVVQTTQF